VSEDERLNAKGSYFCSLLSDFWVVGVSEAGGKKLKYGNYKK